MRKLKKEEIEKTAGGVGDENGGTECNGGDGGAGGSNGGDGGSGGDGGDCNNDGNETNN